MVYDDRWISIKPTGWHMSFQVVQGLLIHPYQAMRQLVREKVFVWMACSPVLLWFLSLFVETSKVHFSIFPYLIWIFLHCGLRWG